MIQHFRLLNCDTDEAKPIDDNLSFMKKEAIYQRMEQYITEFNWDKSKRYVAVGDAGDCVIFENGIIDMVSDSG